MGSHARGSWEKQATWRRHDKSDTGALIFYADRKQSPRCQCLIRWMETAECDSPNRSGAHCTQTQTGVAVITQATWADPDAHMSHCKHTERMMGVEPSRGGDSTMMRNELGLGNADYVWWMRIMWRLHSCTVRGLCDNSMNWSHRFHVFAMWKDLIMVAFMEFMT